MSAGTDPFDLRRFVAAQEPVYAEVVAELRAGWKRSHWMWFVFPQIAGLGASPMAATYAIASLDEARAYLAHASLGARLRECVGLANRIDGRPAEAIFGHTDAMKFRSCLTLFGRASPGDAVFREALAKYFAGEEDPLTLARLEAGATGRAGPG